MDKSPDAFRTISEAAELLDLPQHVLRFWETRFTQIKPLKRGGGRRYYRPDDINLLKGIRYLLYDQGFTIKGVQRILKEQGAKHVVEIGETGQLPNNFSYANSDDDEDSHESLAAQSLAPSINSSDLDALKSVMENLETALQLIKSVKKAKTE